MALKEAILKAKESLSKLVTADNTEAVAEVSKALDEISTQGDELEKTNTSLKDKIVDMVKGTLSTDKAPKDDVSGDTQKSLDEIMLEEANKIIDKK